MKNKKKKNQTPEKEKTLPKKSKEYTIEELIELGKKHNIIELAPPLYNKKEQDD